MTKKVNTKFLRKMVTAFWEVKTEEYLVSIEESGNYDRIVHDSIVAVPGGYAWFNRLEGHQQQEFIYTVGETVAELI